MSRTRVAVGRQVVELAIESELVCPFDPPADRPVPDAIPDLGAAVALGIDSPYEYPALRHAIVPGDHVTLVLDSAIPQPDQILAPIVECLIAGGVRHGDITILCASLLDGQFQQIDQDHVPPGINFVEHDPHNGDDLSYLASTAAGHRVYFNKHIVDADVVITVGRISYDPIQGYAGTSSGFYPLMSDADSIDIFMAQINDTYELADQLKIRKETDEIAWLLGARFGVQVILGADDEALALFVGENSAIQHRGQELLENIWGRSAQHRSELVIASIGGVSQRKGFREIALALDSARRLVTSGGRIVLLTDISAEPGPLLSQFARLDEPDQVGRLLENPASDLVQTCQIARACTAARVYLMSHLDDNLVEDLFMLPLDDLDDIARLAKTVDSCHILSNAHLLQPVVEESYDD